jgi:hypothetical protein
VQSPAPYGAPRGAIVDIAPVVDGQIQRDKVLFADSIPTTGRPGPTPTSARWPAASSLFGVLPSADRPTERPVGVSDRSAADQLLELRPP